MVIMVIMVIILVVLNLLTYNVYKKNLGKLKPKFYISGQRSYHRAFNFNNHIPASNV